MSSSGSPAPPEQPSTLSGLGLRLSLYIARAQPSPGPRALSSSPDGSHLLLSTLGCQQATAWSQGRVTSMTSWNITPRTRRQPPGSSLVFALCTSSDSEMQGRENPTQGGLREFTLSEGQGPGGRSGPRPGLIQRLKQHPRT